MPRKQTKRAKRKIFVRRKFRVSKKKMNAKAAEQIPRNREEALIRKIVQMPRRSPGRHLQIQDLIYNLDKELQILAFKTGFNLGSEAYKHSDKSIASLEHILENAGLGKMVYYPFESNSMIASYKIKSKGIRLGTNIHVFEAGVISGFLSTHSRKRIIANEMSCVFNGAPVCQFMAALDARYRPELNVPLEFQNMIRALQNAILTYEKPAKNDHYYVLSMHPLLRKPLLPEAEKFMYLSGKMVSRSISLNLVHAIERAAHLLGVEKARMTIGKDKKPVVSLTYRTITSTNPFVDISTALLSGMLKGGYGGRVSITKELGNKGVYNVKMQVIS